MTALKLADKLPDFLHSHHLTGSSISEEQGGTQIKVKKSFRYVIGVSIATVITKYQKSIHGNTT